jgi:ribosomal protein S7
MSKAKVNKSEIIRKMYDDGKTPQQIEVATRYSKPLINIVLRNYKKKARKSKIIKAVTEVKQALDKIEMRRPKQRLQATETDLVNHPPHYRVGGVETIDFIEAKDLNYRLGNVVKYVSRAGKKDSDPVQDLEKAAWYLQREITARKGA